jgi:competence protein ComEA
MESVPSAAKSDVPLPPAADSPALLTWPKSVQLALGLLLTAGMFFLLGRWSSPQPVPIVAIEQAGSALDINRASKAELRLLPGIGDALAQRVVEHRQRNGPFRNVESLRQVAGFGPKTLDRLRPLLFVSHVEPFGANEESEMVKPAGKSRTSTVSKKVADLTTPINVNHANQTELQKLPGIGPKLSQRILDERAKTRFKSIEDLRRVPGIGAKTLDKLRPYVTIEDVRTVVSATED